MTNYTLLILLPLTSLLLVRWVYSYFKAKFIAERAQTPLNRIPWILSYDREVALAAVAQNGLALPEVSNTFKGDIDVLLAAIANTEISLEFASLNLRRNRNFMLKAVAQNGWALRYASATLQDDRDVVMVAVAQNGSALQFASAELRAEHDVVMAAVSQNGRALAFASATLKEDRDFILEAVAQNRGALQYASATLQNSETGIRAYIRSIQSYIFRDTMLIGMDNEESRLRKINLDDTTKIFLLNNIAKCLGISFDGDSTESFTVKQQKTAYLAASNLYMNKTALPFTKKHINRSETDTKSSDKTIRDFAT